MFIGTLPGMFIGDAAPAWFIGGAAPAWFIGGAAPAWFIGGAAPACFKEEVELVNIQREVGAWKEGISTFVVSWISLRTSSSKLLLAFTAFPRCYSPSSFPRCYPPAASSRCGVVSSPP